MRPASLLSLLFIFGTPVSAQDIHVQNLQPLLGDSLVNAFENITMDGIYKRPRERSGTDRFTETFLSDGTTRYREGRIFDQGEWVTSFDTICFSYEGQLGNRLSCYNVFQKDGCYYSYLKANVKDGQPININGWAAKTVVSGDDLACPDLIT